jgi:hypothetical protein
VCRPPCAGGIVSCPPAGSVWFFGLWNHGFHDYVGIRKALEGWCPCSLRARDMEIHLRIHAYANTHTHTQHARAHRQLVKAEHWRGGAPAVVAPVTSRYILRCAQLPFSLRSRHTPPLRNFPLDVHATPFPRLPRGIVEDMCYEIRRAQACEEQSAHHELVNAGMGPVRNPELERRPSTLAGLTMLACVLQTARTPFSPHFPFYTEQWLQSDNDTFFLCSCSRNMSNNQPEGLSSLLSPLDYTCSSKGMSTNKHVRTYN